MSEKNIVPISIPGIHQAFWPYFVENTKGEKNKGTRLWCRTWRVYKETVYEAGYDVSACDLFPEIFYYDKVECKKANVTEHLPFEDRVSMPL